MWKLILLDMAVSPEYMTNMAAWDNFKGSPTHPRLEAVSKTCILAKERERERIKERSFALP